MIVRLHVSPVEVRLVEVAIDRVSFLQTRAHEIGVGEIPMFDDCPAKVGKLEDSVFCHYVVHFGMREGGSLEHGLPRIGLREITAGQVRQA